jgi:hypothetical protein
MHGRRWVTRLSILGALTLATTPMAAQASPVFFKSPTGNIVCQTLGPRLMCSLYSTRRADGSLAVYFLRARGRATVHRIVGDPAFDVPVLRYGRTKHLLGGGVRCTMRRDGLTCRNRSVHGYFLSRQRRRLF